MLCSLPCLCGIFRHCGAPKAPLILFTGPSGSGKTSTVRQMLERVVFLSEVRPEVDLEQKKEEDLAFEPFWKTIDHVYPTLASGIAQRKKLVFYTANIVLDEIISGQRDCLLIATTDQPERFDPAVYRRFVEKGKIIDLSDFWKNPENLSEVIRLELMRNDVVITETPADEAARLRRFHHLHLLDEL